MGHFVVRRNRVASLLGAGYVLLITGRVDAQVSPDSGVRIEGIVTHSVPLDGERASDTLSRADCERGDVLSFPLALSNPDGYQLEAWAGTACDRLANRTTLGLRSCWQLVSQAPSGASVSVYIHARDILAGQKSLWAEQAGAPA